jgi:hypothetical protein
VCKRFRGPRLADTPDDGAAERDERRSAIRPQPLMTQDSLSPIMPQAAGVAAPDVPALAFADADGAKRWAKSLMVTGVNPLYLAILGQLRALSAASFTPRERATIAEVLREQVAH